MSEIRIGANPPTDAYRNLPDGLGAVIIAGNIFQSKGERKISYTAQLGEVLLFSTHADILSRRQKLFEHDGIGMDIYPYEIDTTDGWVGIRNIANKRSGEDFVDIHLRENEDVRLVTTNADNIAEPRIAVVTNTLFSLEGLETFSPGRFTARPLTTTLSQTLYDFQMKQGRFSLNEENA